jgi:ketosteroid isomerase-like protein
MATSNVKLVRDWFKAGLWTEAGLAMATSDVEWVLPATIATAVLDGRRLVGAAGLRELGYLSVAMYAARQPPEIQFMVDGNTAEGHDWVVMQTRVGAVLHNGAGYSNSYCFTFRISDGKVAEVHEHFDSKLLYDLAMGTAEDLAGVRQRIEQARAADTG